jgi:TonB-dependent receptor
MQCNIRFLLTGLVILGAGYNLLFAASSGRIAGIISDAATDKPLAGANISLKGTGIGAASNLDGEYFILQVPAGQYNLIVSYIGYKEKTVSVNIESDKTAKLNIKLALDVLEGETIEVSAQAEGQAAAINQQIQSNTIKNIVSSERIMEVPDANAAESIGRLPGISVTRSGGEANRIVIRGLAPAYNNITIGGELVPATGLDDRAVDLNMVSPTMLASIEVTKALTSDMDASAFGGTVNLKLNDAPEGFKYNFRLQGGYNDQRSDWDQYKTFFTLSNRFGNNKFGLMVTGDLQRVQRGSDQLNSNWFAIHTDALQEGDPPLFVWGPSLQYSDEQRDRASFSVFMDYQLPNGQLKFTNLISRLDRNEKLTEYYFNNDLNYFSPSYRERIQQIDVLQNSLGGEHLLDFGEITWQVSRLASTTRHPSDITFLFREENALDMTNLVGKGYYGPADLIAVARRDLTNTHLFDVNLRQEHSNEEDITAQLNLKIPYTLTSLMAGYVKLGGKVLDKSRDRDRSRDRISSTDIGNDFRHPDGSQLEYYHSQYGTPGFEFLRVITGQPSVINYMDPDFKVDNFLDSQYPFDLGFNADELMRLYNLYLRDNLAVPRFIEDLDDYEIEERVSAGYIMSELNIGQMVMLMPGVRYEYTENNLTGRTGSFPTEDFVPDPSVSRVADTSAVKWYGNWFPMLHLRVRPLEWFDIRLAYTQAISRPRYSWLMPGRNIGSTSITLGNPDLKPQISTNYDVFLSFYANKLGLLTLGAFHKDIDDLIYRRGGHLLLTAEDAIKYGLPPQYKGMYLNVPENVPFETKLDGFEFEWQANFYWLPKPLDGLVFSINYTHIWSETKYPKSIVVSKPIPKFPFVQKSVVDSFRVGKMINQPDDILNASIGYDKGPFSARVSFLFQGRTLRGIGDLPREDSYTEELMRTDLSVRYRITDHFSLFLNVNNLTNEPDESFQIYEEWPRLFPTAIEYYGWTLDFGIGISN